MLQSTESQRVRHDLAIEQQKQQFIKKENLATTGSRSSIWLVTESGFRLWKFDISIHSVTPHTLLRA